ncbi:MAG TPA: tetratricopeptide repeat protein [Magnetovibrio sp.]
MNRTSLRIATVIIAMSAVSACGAIQDSEVFQPEFWNLKSTYDAGVPQNTEAELGLAELAKGNNYQAQGHFEKALKAYPDDVHALYGLAQLYQNTDQPSKARALYEQILSIRPAPSEEILIWAGKQPYRVVDVAQVNLQMLQNDTVNAQHSTMAAPGMQQPGVEQGTAQPMSQLYVQPQAQAAASAPVDEPMFQAADLNIVARFKAMRALLAQGLITQEEFLQRRQVNLGALLPMTSNPPATGLDRPVPGVDQISARLNAIGRALEMRALSPAQHMAERTMILDALMPAQPASVANPPAPPQGLMAAADAVRRLEMLNQADLITSDEYAKERAAIEGSMQPAAGKPMAGASQPSDKGEKSSGPSNLSGFQPGVHLASFRQQGAAEKGWAELTRKFPALSELTPNIERVDLGATKGVFYRLKAGPLPSNDAAKNLCRQLKAKRQYCEPTTINFG